MKNIISVFILVFSPIITWCQKANYIGPHLIVYKTKHDYSRLVPITLSGDKTRVINYPDPQDIRLQERKQMPTLLHKGYLLDNRGISKNVAFLRLTYNEFAKLKSPPTQSEMLDMIVDKNPLKILCDCGLRGSFDSPVVQINHFIDSKMLLKKCKEL